MAGKNSHEKAQNQPKNKADHLIGHRFAKGKSGNPGGRPKGSGILSELRKSLDKTKLLGKPLPEGKTARELVGEAILFHVIKGNAGYLAKLLEYIYGRMPVKVQATGETEGENPLTPELAAELRGLMRERLKAVGEGE